MLLKEVAVELHDTLNPKLWDENNNLRPVVKDRLIRIVDKYIESSDVITKEDVSEVELLGSNASYNSTPYSDLDVHLVVKWDAVSCDPALFQLACNAERSNFNKNYDITIKGIEIEMYVEDVKASTASNGIYSLYKDEWIKFPQKITVPNYDSDEEYIALLDKWKSLAETVLGSANEAQQVQDYINNLYNLRRTSIMTDGEFGKGNLVFKEIRNLGLLDKLKEKQYELSSKELSLESLLVKNKDNYYNIVEDKKDVSPEASFIESATFTKAWQKAKLDNDALRRAQHLIRNKSGKIDSLDNAGKIKKIRIEFREHGKRGGTRIIFFDFIVGDETYLLDVYSKDNKEDVSHEEVKLYKELVKELEEEYERHSN